MATIVMKKVGPYGVGPHGWSNSSAATRRELTAGELVIRYRELVKEQARNYDADLLVYRAAMRPVFHLYGCASVNQFGVQELRLCAQEWRNSGCDLQQIARYRQIVCDVWRWGVTRGFVRPDAAQRLCHPVDFALAMHA